VKNAIGRSESGRGDVLYQVARQREYPGWGYMVSQGATTIWEGWGMGTTWQAGIDGGSEESMIMWATIDEFFYGYLAGIEAPSYYGPSNMTPGFKQIHIEPHVVGDLHDAEASITTVRGVISSHWMKQGDSLNLDVVIPANSEAELRIPKGGVKNPVVEEGGNSVWKLGHFMKGAIGISGASETGDYIDVRIGSGSYHFILAPAQNGGRL